MISVSPARLPHFFTPMRHQAIFHAKIDVSSVADDTVRIGTGLATLEAGHKGLSTAAGDLSFSIRALTNHVKSELHNINDTMTSMQQRFFGYGHFISVLRASWSGILPYRPN